MKVGKQNLRVQSGFATPTIFMLLTGLVSMTLYTSYIVYLQSCLHAHQHVRQKNNALVSSAELYTKKFLIENWHKLHQYTAGETIIIDDLFKPHVTGHRLVLSEWHIQDNYGTVNYCLMHHDQLLAHKKMELRNDVGGTFSWQVSHL